MPKNLETPAQEMSRLIRVVAGRAKAGEKDEQLRARAARRMGIGASRAKVLWYAETENIKSEEMDRVRELAFVQPLQEAEDALVAAEKFLEGLRERLAARLRAGGPDRGIMDRRSSDRRKEGSRAGGNPNAPRGSRSGGGAVT